MSLSARVSSGPAFYLVTIGAAVGLGSIWRFPYLAGRYGGGLFVVAFLAACAFIAVPLLVAEFYIGKMSRASPPRAAGVLAARVGLRRGWDAIGALGTLSSFMVFSYYTMIAGWVVSYAIRTATGSLSGLAAGTISDRFHDFLASPAQIFAWQMGFVVLTGVVSSSGLKAGIERISAFRAPALLLLLLVLVGYALVVGDTEHGLAFAFAPRGGTLSGGLLLAAVSQAFFATGVGMAMMIAYGSYIPDSTSLLRSAIFIVLSIVVVSLLATLLIFPLVFRYHLDPAQGAKLVFEVLPVAFAEMPGGRIVGTSFFTLLALAALTPAIATLEPAVAWLEGRGMDRRTAAFVVCVAGILLGIGSVLSFNVLADVHPLAVIPGFGARTYFDIVDFVSADVLIPLGALITSIFVGWVLPRKMAQSRTDAPARHIDRWLLILVRYLCPIAILAVFAGALT
jgi:NSS family neurotransmitter:Na+ symporter